MILVANSKIKLVLNESGLNRFQRHLVGGPETSLFSCHQKSPAKPRLQAIESQNDVALRSKTLA